MREEGQAQPNDLRRDGQCRGGGPGRRRWVVERRHSGADRILTKTGNADSACFSHLHRVGLPVLPH